ncbi:hypothetical protein [Luteococcus sp. OSA5]|uniref:hypothetical protein n=1 Tax=Luteococcus sp. OSA5 TaxID=3401630 RepID=UPI003B432380
MSTTIDIYPLSDHLPLVEQTRARTQQLFQELLDRHDVPSVIEVRAFHPNTDPVEEIALGTRWAPGLEVGFAYWLNGVWDSSSWPTCESLSGDEEYGNELKQRLNPEQVAKLNSARHCWFEYRSLGSSAIASTGYGLAAIALAEAVDGRLVSWDCAYEDAMHDGDTAAEFLNYWGEYRLSAYGTSAFLKNRRDTAQDHVD